MSYDLDIDRSFLSSLLFEFCVEVLVPKRKQQCITQKEASNKLGLNQSEISRIERGLVRPRDIPTIEAICDLYGLNTNEKRKYFELAVGVQQQNSDDIILSLLEDQINFVAHMNRSGQPKAATILCRHLLCWVESVVDLSGVVNKQIIEKVLNLLLEECAAWWDIVIPDELDSKTLPLMNKMSNLANILGTREQESENIYVNINKGFHEYVKKHYENAQIYFHKVLENREIEGHPWEVEVLRADTIVAGKLKNINTLEDRERIVEKYILEPNDLTNKGYLLEGLGRGYSGIDNSKALSFYNKAWEYVREASNQPRFLTIRKIQLTRSYLDLLRKMPVKAVALKRIAEPALNEADKAGFVRHRKQIQEIINN